MCPIYGFQYNEMRYLKSKQTQKALMSTDQRFANVRFYCNGQYSNEIQHNDGVVSGDMLSLRMQQIQHLVSLVYWCKDGWSRPDKVKVACMLKDFKSLKYLVTDTSQKQLLSLGFNSTVHKFLSSYMIESSKLVGGQNSRNWYIHVFSANNLPIIQDCEFPHQETTDVIEKEILELTTLMDNNKRSRRIGSPILPTTQSNYVFFRFFGGIFATMQ